MTRTTSNVFDEAEVLLDRIADGDKNALGNLYDCLGPTIYSFYSTRLSRPSAEDATIRTFLDLWANAPRFRATHESAASWIFGYVRRTPAMATSATHQPGRVEIQHNHGR